MKVNMREIYMAIYAAAYVAELQRLVDLHPGGHAGVKVSANCFAAKTAREWMALYHSPDVDL